MRASACVLILILLCRSAFADNGNPQTASQRDKPSDAGKTSVATVFGEPVYLEDLNPENVEAQRKELSAARFDSWLHEHRGRQAYWKVWSAVVKRYVEREKITVTDGELAAIAQSVDRRLKSDPELSKGSSLSPEQNKGLMVAWSRASLMDWKVCKSLYEKYGGRVGIGSLGSWTAWDGQTALLREHAKAGDIQFADAALEEAFWQHTRIKNFADAYPTGERLEQLLATPPYLRN